MLTFLAPRILEIYLPERNPIYGGKGEFHRLKTIKKVKALYFYRPSRGPPTATEPGSFVHGVE